MNPASGNHPHSNRFCNWLCDSRHYKSLLDLEDFFCIQKNNIIIHVPSSGIKSILLYTSAWWYTKDEELAVA